MDDIQQAREGAGTAYAAREWSRVRAELAPLRTEGAASASDLEMLAEAAWWQGDVETSVAINEEAYELHLRGDEPQPRAAAMVAMDIGFTSFLRGEEVIGSGWLSRAQRLVDGHPDWSEQGYLASLGVDVALAQGRHAEAIEMARSIAAMGRDAGDEDLVALALTSEGIARIKLGEVAEGLAVLDEAMLPVVAGRVRPTFAGNIYCQLMSVCHELADLRRARQWTEATARWCDGFESAVMFIGVCSVHRAQVLQNRGEWERAEVEIQRVCDDLASLNTGAVGMALYELGEVRRQRGDLDGAEAAYTDAHRHGCDPQPGLALVSSARGRHADALSALRAAESATPDRLARTRLWQAQVAVGCASGDLDEAARACELLGAAAAMYASSGLLAASALARGEVELRRGELDDARARLEDARSRWQELEVPERVARTRELLAEVHTELGNDAAAELERSAARDLRERLGIRADVSAPRRPGGLTPREVEVLALVARGHTNREVAATLVLSDKTVARHLANIYVKLGVGSRTAAAAFAHEHGIVAPVDGSSAQDEPHG